MDTDREVSNGTTTGWLTSVPAPNGRRSLRSARVRGGWRVTLANWRRNYQICSLLLALTRNPAAQDGPPPTAAPAGRPAARPGAQRVRGNCRQGPELIEENYSPGFPYKFLVRAAFPKLRGEIRLQGETPTGLLMTARRASILPAGRPPRPSAPRPRAAPVPEKPGFCAGLFLKKTS